MFSPSELIVIRHGEPDTGGRLCGRTDVGLMPGTAAALARLSQVLPPVDRVRVSPARRCRETLAGLWPGVEARPEPRFWEQDFGDWDGLSLTDIPDVGHLDRLALADLAAPDGESYADMVARVAPALREAARTALEAGPVVVVAHAGTVRAALSLALEDVPAGLAFEVDPLSVTRFRCLPEGGLSVISVNWSPV